jgi:hypothetical protein
MKKKQIKIVIAIAFIVIALGSVYAYTEFNRKATSTEDLKSEFNTSAAEIIVEFEKDNKTSNTKYLNKTIEVTGHIKTVEDQLGTTIVLGDSIHSTSIRCSMDSSFHAKTSYTNGQVITIKGIYTGFNADDLGIGSDIIINKSIIKQ